MIKSYIESLGYIVDEISDQILLVRDLITDEELDELIQIATSASEDEWKNHYMQGVIDMAKLKFGRDDIENLVKEGLYEVTENWIDKNLKISDYEVSEKINKKCRKIFEFDNTIKFNGCGTIQRQYNGVPLKDHVDNHTDPSLVYASVIYLNEDYIDGEVYFVNQGIELRPPKKSMLIFPTSEEWRHGVKAPGDGPHRYVIPCFISRKNYWEGVE